MNKNSKQVRSIRLGEKDYQYTLRRSRRAKHVLLHVHTDGQIELIVPWYVSYARGEQFVAAKHDWLQQMLQKQEQARPPAKILTNGSELPYFGQIYHLQVDMNLKRKRATFQEKDDKVTVFIAHAEQIPALVMRWYRQKSREYFVGQSIAFADRLGVRVNQVKVLNTKTQWGSCNKAKGTLTFHWKLAMMPEEVAQYVVAHEVAHLKYANHSKNFWNTVGELYPSFEETKRWLRKNGHITLL